MKTSPNPWLYPLGAVLKLITSPLLRRKLLSLNAQHVREETLENLLPPRMLRRIQCEVPSQIDVG